LVCQTGKLLDILTGHQGPISALVFNPIQSMLASVSWDKTLRLWDIYEGGKSSTSVDTFDHSTDLIALAFRPDGKELCTSSLDGNLSFWDPINGFVLSL